MKFLVCLLLALMLQVEARGQTAVKQVSAAWWNSLSQHVSVLPPRVSRLLPRMPKRLLQKAAMTAALCTTLACGGATQEKKQAETTEPVVTQQALETIEPVMVRKEVAIIKTHPALNIDERFLSIGGITHTSVDAYQQAQPSLSAEFYDGMLVHYVKHIREGKYFEIERMVDEIRMVELQPDGTLLSVSNVSADKQEQVQLSEIRGVLLSSHPDYGREDIGFQFQHGHAFNEDDMQSNSDYIDTYIKRHPKEYAFGAPVAIFSDATVVRVYDSAGDPNYYMVDAEHLVDRVTEEIVTAQIHQKVTVTELLSSRAASSPRRTSGNYHSVRVQRLPQQLMLQISDAEATMLFGGYREWEQRSDIQYK